MAGESNIPKSMTLRGALGFVGPRGALVVLGCAALSSMSCGAGRASDQVPAPPAIVAPRAQSDLRELESEWQARGSQGRAALSPRFDDFIRRYPNDPGALRARVLYGWIEMERGHLEGASEILGPALAAGESANRDRARVVSAAVMTRSQRPEAALEILSPLRGKLVGEDFIELYGRERVKAAIGARRWRLVVSALTEWLGETTRRPDRVHEAARAALAGVPAHVLLRFLEEEAQGASRDAPSEEGALARSDASEKKADAAERWIERASLEQLTRAALRDQDPRLARQVLAVAPSWLRASEDGERLSLLAASGAVEARIEGRTLGFVFSDHDATARRRSADVSSGAVEALGLGRAEGGGDVRFVVREGRDELTTALAALAGEGASVLLAGVDEASATVALNFAEQKRVPVIVLVDPPDRQGQLRYGFVLGTSLAMERRTLEDELGRRGAKSNVVVGPGGVSCHTEPTYPGGPRFPVLAWQRDAFAGVVVLGDAACAETVAKETRAQRYFPLLALGLDAATGRMSLPAERLVLEADAPESASEAAPSGWYARLGRDAARLAQKALASLPPDAASDPELVRAHLEKARGALATARAPLSTTHATGFNGSQVLSRRFRVVSQGAPEKK